MPVLPQATFPSFSLPSALPSRQGPPACYNPPTLPCPSPAPLDPEDNTVRLASCRALLLSALLAAGVVSLAIGQPPSARGKPADKKKALPAPPLTFPPGTVVAVYESVADALKKMPPSAVVLSAGEVQGIDRRDRPAEGPPRPSRARTPGKCVLKGKIEGGLVQMQAQFEFTTETPFEVVRLGCGLAQATGVTLDGRTPPLFGGRSRPTAKGQGADDDLEGFTVAVEKPGNHLLTLDMVLALSARPAGQGFLLDLPRAAMTSLELELPEGVKDVHVGGKSPAEAILVLKPRMLSGNLGVADRLEVNWKSAQASSATAVLAAEGTILVHVDTRQIVTTAELTLRVLGGQTRQWRLLTPKGAELKVVDADARVARIETSDQKQASLRTIHLKEASADPLTLTVTSTQPAPKPSGGKPTPIGPFTVLGAVRQSGSVLVNNSVAGWHLEFTPHGDLTRRGATDEELRRNPALSAVFRYGPGGGVSRGPPLVARPGSRDRSRPDQDALRPRASPGDRRRGDALAGADDHHRHAALGRPRPLDGEAAGRLYLRGGRQLSLA